MNPQKVIYIYPDVAFVVSLLMNGLILWGTAKIQKIQVRWMRITAGAVFGAMYSFAAAFPQLGVLQKFWVKVPFSLIMVAAAFAPLNIKKYTAVTAVFYIVSFSLGGFFIGILYFLSTNPLYDYLSSFSELVSTYFLPALFITIIAYIVFTKYAGRLIQKRLSQNLFLVPVVVHFDGFEARLTALIDTGNSLHDPLTRIPVIVVEYIALREIIPPEIREVFEEGKDVDLMTLLESVSGTHWSTKFRVIPFTSVGRENGMLVGFKPDFIEIFNGDSHLNINNVIVGIYQRELSPEGGYSALLHPEILDLITA